MFDICTLMNIAFINVQADAQANGREATPAEYQAALEKTWDVWMNASVARDMAAAGFTKTADGWKKPRRGFWRSLLGA